MRVGARIAGQPTAQDGRQDADFAPDRVLGDGDRIAIDAMKAGKDVYLEKPMIHLYSDGPQIIEAGRSTNRILQVGSQRVSSIIYKKAQELVRSGSK